MNGRAAKLTRRIALEARRPLSAVRREWRALSGRARGQVRKRLGLTETHKRLRIEKMVRRQQRAWDRWREARRAAHAWLFRVITQEKPAP